MRLHVDENVAAEVVSLLRQEHDVVYHQEAGEKGQTDVWQLLDATAATRVLVSVNDRDFRFIHRSLTTVARFGGDVKQHAGILTVTRRPDAAAWATAISRIVREETDLAGRFLIWHPDKDRWDEDDWRPER